MGQYFTPVIINDDREVIQSLYSHEYGYGLKLWEHGQLESPFVAMFESLLALDGARRVVWAGDYAPGEPEEIEWIDEEGEQCKAKLNLFSRAHDGTEVHFDFELDPNHYYASRPEAHRIPVPVAISSESHPYLLNHDKGLYVDKRKALADARGMKGHPLVFLTAEGSSLESYFAADTPIEHLKLIGSWARDRISVGTSVPEDWKELEVPLH